MGWLEWLLIAGTTGTTTGTSSSGGEEGTTSSTGSDTGSSTTEVMTSACLSAPEDDSDADTGPCLSIDPNAGNDDGCAVGDRSGAELALLLPLLALARRSRKEAFDHLAEEGRLPSDVLDRLRKALTRDPR